MRLLGACLVAPAGSALPGGEAVPPAAQPLPRVPESAASSASRRLRRPLSVQAHLVANVLAVAKQAVPKLKGDWSVVQALYLKSAESVALPVYQRPSGSKE